MVEIWARLLYRHCSKNISGCRRHPRSVVAYSAKVAHRAVPMRQSLWNLLHCTHYGTMDPIFSRGVKVINPVSSRLWYVYFQQWQVVIAVFWHLSVISAICNFWPQHFFFGGGGAADPLTRPSRPPELWSNPTHTYRVVQKSGYPVLF